MTDSPLFCALCNWNRVWTPASCCCILLNQRCNSTCGSFSNETGKRAMSSKLWSLLFNSLIFKVFFKLCNLKVLIFFLIWILLLSSHCFLSLKRKEEQVWVFCYSFLFSIPLCTFQNRSNIFLMAKDQRNFCHFINSKVKQQKREKWEWENLKQTQNCSKGKAKNFLYFYCLLSAESCLSCLLFLFLLHLQ